MKRSVVVIADSHERRDHFAAASVVLDQIAADGESCKEIYHAGDWADGVNYDNLQKLESDVIKKDQELLRLARQASFISQSIRSYIQSECKGDFASFQKRLEAGDLPDDVVRYVEVFDSLQENLQKKLTPKLFLEEARLRLGFYNDQINECKKKGVRVLGVKGNHDPNNLEQIITAADFVDVNSDVPGHNVSFPPTSDGRSLFAGLPELAAPFGRPGDEDCLYGHTDVPKMLGARVHDKLEDCRSDSEWYVRASQRNDIHTVLAHHGPRLGIYCSGRVIPHDIASGGGLTAWVAEKHDGVTVICGHVHEGVILNQKGRLIINPGKDHVAEVIYERNNVVGVILYDLKGKFVDYFGRADLSEQGFPVWMGKN